MAHQRIEVRTQGSDDSGFGIFSFVFVLLCFFAGLYFIGNVLEAIPVIGTKGTIFFMKYILPLVFYIWMTSKG